MTPVPQPHPSRITPFAGHPIVVGVAPDVSPVVVLTAADWAGALGVPAYFAYVDPGRVTEREFEDGTVQHSDLDPDLGDDERWRERQAGFERAIADLLSDRRISWEFRYLAGRPDRALTHLARAVDAAAIVVGSRESGVRGRVHELLDGSVGAHLAQHQHRPVLVVPTSVVDWRTPLEWR